MAVNVLTYTRNVARSFGYTAIDTLKSYNPSVTALATESVKLSSELYTSIKDFKSNIKEKSSEDSFVGQTKDFIKDMWTSIKEDALSGNYYNKQRIESANNEMFKSMLGDDFDFDFNFDDDDTTGGGFDDFSFDDDDDGTDNSGAVADTVAAAEAKSARAIVTSVDCIAEKSVGAINKATVLSADHISAVQERSSRALYALNERNFSQITTGLGSISASMSILQSVAEPLTSHMQNSATFYTKSTEYQEKVLTILEDIKKNTVSEEEESSSSSSKKWEMSDFVTDGILDLGNIADAFKSGVSEYTEMITSLLDMVGGVKGAGKMISASPLKMLMELGIDKILPEAMKKTMKGFNEMMEDVSYNMIGKFQDTKDLPMVIDLIKDFVMPDLSYKESINPNMFKKGKMPWDGIAKHALTTVIPAQLSKIVTALTGEDRTIFDYRIGRWKKIKTLKGEVKQSKKRRMLNNDLYTDAKYALSEQKRLGNISENKEKEYISEVETYLEKAVTSNGFEYSEIMSPSFNEKAKSWGLSEDGLQLLRSIIKAKIASGDIGYLQRINAASLKNREDLRRLDVSLSKEGGPVIEAYNGGYTEEEEKRENSGLKNNNLFSNNTDDKGHNVFFYLQGIYKFTQHLSDNVGNMGGGSGKKSKGKNKIVSIKEIKSVLNDEQKKESSDQQNKNNSEYTGPNKLNLSDDVNDKNSVRSFILDNNEETKWLNYSTKELTDYVKMRKRFLAQDGKTEADWKSSMDYNDKLEKDMEKEDKFKNAWKSFKDRHADSKLSPLYRTLDKFFGAINKAITVPADTITGLYKSAAASINRALFGEDAVDDKGIVDYIKAITTDTSGFIKNLFTQEGGIFSKLFGTKITEEYTDENGNKKTRKRHTGGLISDFLNKSADTLKDVGSHIKGKLGFATGGKVTKTGITTVHEGEVILPAGRGGTVSDIKDEAEAAEKGQVAEGEQLKPGTIAYFMSKKGTDKDKERINKFSHTLAEAGKLKGKIGDYIRAGAIKKATGKEMLINEHDAENFKQAAQQSVAKLFDGVKIISDMLFGKDPEKEAEKAKKEADEKTKKILEGLNQGQGGIGAGAVLGGGLSILTGGIINPIFGAALGAGVGLIKQSETIQRLLFGEEGNQTDLQKKMQDFILDKVPSIAEGAGFGGAAGMFMGSPVIGAILGGTVGFVASSTGAKDYLFGKGDEDGLITKETQQRIKKALPNIGAGAIAGLIAGPFGLAGNIIMGSALGYATSTEKFKKWLFGEEAEEEYVDENGKTQTRKVRKGGLVESLKSGLTNPIVDVFTGLGTMIKHDLSKIFSNMGKMVKNILAGFKKTFEQSFLGRLLKSKVGNAIGGAVKKLAGGVLGAPGRALGHMKESLDKRALRQGYEIWDNKLKRNLTSEERLARAKELGYDKSLSYIGSTGNTISEALVGKSKEELESLQKSLDKYTKGKDFESYKLDKSRAQVRLKDLAGVDVKDQDLIDKELKKIDKLNKASRKVNSEKERKANQIEMEQARQDLMEKLKGMKGFKNEKTASKYIDDYITASSRYNDRDLEQKKLAEAFGISQKELKDFAAKDALNQINTDLASNNFAAKAEEESKKQEEAKTEAVTKTIPDFLQKIYDILSTKNKSVEETSVMNEEEIKAHNEDTKSRIINDRFKKGKLSYNEIIDYANKGYLDKSVLDESADGKMSINEQLNTKNDIRERLIKDTRRRLMEGKLSDDQIFSYYRKGILTTADIRSMNEDVPEAQKGRVGRAIGAVKDKIKTGFTTAKDNLDSIKDKIKDKLEEPMEGARKEINGKNCIYHNGQWMDKEEYDKDKKFKDSIIGIPGLIVSTFGKDGIFGKLFGPKDEEDEEKESIFDKIFKKLFGDGEDDGILGGIKNILSDAKTFLFGSSGIGATLTSVLTAAIPIAIVAALTSGKLDNFFHDLADKFGLLKGNDTEGHNALDSNALMIGDKQVKTDASGNAVVDANGNYTTLDGYIIDQKGNVIDPHTNQVISSVDVNDQRKLGENNSASSLTKEYLAKTVVNGVAKGGTTAAEIMSKGSLGGGILANSAGKVGNILATKGGAVGSAAVNGTKLVGGFVGKVVKQVSTFFELLIHGSGNAILKKIPGYSAKSYEQLCKLAEKEFGKRAAELSEAEAAQCVAKQSAGSLKAAFIINAFLDGVENTPSALGVITPIYEIGLGGRLVAGLINALKECLIFTAIIPLKVFYNILYTVVKAAGLDKDWDGFKDWDRQRAEATAIVEQFNKDNPDKNFSIEQYNDYMKNYGAYTAIKKDLGKDVSTIANEFKKEGIGETLSNIGKGFVETVKDDGLLNTLVVNPLKENTVGRSLNNSINKAVDYGVEHGNKLALGYDKFMTGVGNAAVGVENMYNSAKTGLANAGKWAGEKWNNIKEGASDIYHWAGEKVSNAGNWASEKWSNVKEGAADIYNWAAEGITNKFNEFKQGIIDGIVSLKDKLSNNKLVDVGKQYLEVHKILSDGWKGGVESLIAAKRSITDNIGKREDNLFSPFQGVLADIDVVLAAPLAGIVDLGKNISAKFTEIKESISNTLTSSGKLEIEMWNYAKEGDVVSVGNVGRYGNDGPVTKVVSAMIEIPRIFCSFVAAGVQAGRFISDQFTKLKEKTSSTFNTIGNAHNELWSAALQGDLATFNNAGKVDENGNPLYGLASGVIDLDRTISTGIALTVYAGKSVKQKFNEVKEGVARTFNSFGQAHSAIWDAALRGDSYYAIQEAGKLDAEGNPLGDISAGILEIPRTLATGVGFIVYAGKSLKQDFDNMKQKVSNTFSEIGTAHNDIWSAALQGDMTAMENVNITDEEGNPVGGLASGVTDIFKFFAFTPGLLVMGGKAIKDKINSIKESAINQLTSVGSLTDKYKELAENGEVLAVWNVDSSEAENTEGQPLGAVFTITNFLNKIFYSALALFNKITGGIKEKIDGVKNTFNDIAEGASDVWNGVKEWGADAKESVSNAWNDATNFVNDAFGWGSGIKSRKPAGKGGFVSQYDPRYANMSIGGESVEDAGCAPAVASMTASQYGKSLDMRDAVGMANNYQNTNGTTLDYFGAAMGNVGVGTRGLSNTTQVYDDLRSGNPVIMLGQDGGNGSKSRSPFGPSNHYVVATGLDNNGNVVVNDPEANAPRTYSPSIMKNVKAAIGTNSLAGGASRLRRSAYKPATTRSRLGGRGPSDRFPQQIFQFLKENGYTDIQAAAIMGCWQNESGLKHMTIECYYANAFPGYDNLITTQQLSNYTQNVVWPYWRNHGVNPTTSAYFNQSDGGYYPGMGLAQWTGPRAYALINFATSNNLPWYDLKAQLNFFLYETSSGGSRSGTATALKQCNNLEDAVEIFGKGYEGAYKKGSSNYNKAYGYAKTLYQECSGRPASDISALTSNINNNINSTSGSTATTSPIDYMKSILGTIDYSMSGPRNPDKGSADCSSTVRWAIMKAGGPDIGGNTAVQYENPNLTPVWYNNGTPNPKGNIPDGLQPNDVLFFRRDGDYTRGRKDRVGHVGLYLGNGQYIDHGSGMGPKIKNLADSDSLIKASRINGASFTNSYTSTGALGGGIAASSVASGIGSSDSGSSGSGGSILQSIIGWFSKVFSAIFNGGKMDTDSSTATTGGYTDYYGSSLGMDSGLYTGSDYYSSSSSSTANQKTNYNSDGYVWDRNSAILLPNNGKGPNGSYEAQQWAALQKDPDAYVRQIAEWNQRDISKVPAMNAAARNEMLKSSNGLNAYVDYYMNRSAPLGVTRGIFDLTNAKKWSWNRSKAITVPRINTPQDAKTWDEIKNDPDRLAKYIAELNGRDISHVAAMNATAKNELLKTQGGKDAYVDYMMQHSLPLETTWRKWIKGTGASEVERGAKAAGTWNSYLNQNLAGYGSNHKPAGKGAGEYYNDQVAAQRADSLNKAATEARTEKNNITVHETNNIAPTMDKTTAVMLKAIITLVESLVSNTSKVDGIYELLAQLVTQNGKGNEATVAAIGQLAASNANKGVDAGLQALKEAVDSIIAS